MGTRLSTMIEKRDHYGRIIDKLIERWEKEEDELRIDRIAKVGDWYALEYKKLEELIEKYSTK